MEKQEGKNYKWLLLGLLAFTYFLMHATRQILVMSQSWGWRRCGYCC